LDEARAEAAVALSDVIWIIPNRLALAPRPVDAPAFAALVRRGVRTLVNLGAQALPYDLVSRSGFQVEHVPVASTVAPSPVQIERAVGTVRWSLAAGLPVAVLEGDAGAGHAAVVAAGYLVAEGATAEAAVGAVRAAAPGALGARVQADAVEAFAVQSRPAAPAAAAGAGHARTASSPRALLGRLLEGNRRYVAGRMYHPRQGAFVRDALASGQHPFAAVLGCADSRVPVEIVFDQGLGDLFVVRSAGPVVDEAVLGSLEYAVQQYAIPLLLVLVHEACGAVTAGLAAAKGEFRPEGHLQRLVSAIAPAVSDAAGRPGDPVENAVRAHCARLVAGLRREEPTLAPAVAGGRLEVVGARYDLDTGLVEVIDP
jgi:carbonic anhydrase